MDEERAFSLGDWLGVIGVVVGVLAIIAAYIFYRLSLAEREPVFLVHPERTPLIKSESLKASPIRVTRADGTPIQGDVTALRFFFWNNGKAPIRGSDVYQSDPLLLSFTGDIEILDVKTLTISRPKIVRPLLTVSAVTPVRTIRFSFDTLEEDDGFSAQVIYAGPPTTKFDISGTILGVKNIEHVFAEEVEKFWRLYTTMMWVYVPMLVGLLAWRLRLARRNRPFERSAAGGLVERLRFMLRTYQFELTVALITLTTLVMAASFTFKYVQEGVTVSVLQRVPKSIRQ